MNVNRDKLIALYQQMYEMTEPECRLSCRCPQSCCSPEYCEITIEYAKERWGVDLTRGTHPKLPLMGEIGCLAAPHLRPICTLHTCDINSLGFKKGVGKEAGNWTKRYFKLRSKIEELEWATPSLLFP